MFFYKKLSNELDTKETMRYILTLTLRPDTPVPDGNFVYQMGVGKFFSQKLSINANYYNLTIRVVNLTGEQLAVFDAFHNADKFLETFIHRGNRSQFDRERIRGSSFVIGVTDDYLRAEIQCLGEPKTETPAIAFETMVPLCKGIAPNAKQPLSIQKDNVCRKPWAIRIVSPLQMTPMGQNPPLEELPFDLVNFKDDACYMTNKLVGIFDAKAPESTINTNTNDSCDADSVMGEFCDIAKSHTLATSNRKSAKDKAERCGRIIATSEYTTRSFVWDEISRLTDSEYKDALLRLQETENKAPLLHMDRSAFFARGLEILSPEEQQQYLFSSPFFSNCDEYAFPPEHYKETARLDRLPTRLGFNYPAEGAFFTERFNDGHKVLRKHTLISPEDIKILSPRVYESALEGTLPPPPPPLVLRRPVTNNEEMHRIANQHQFRQTLSTSATPEDRHIMLVFGAENDPSGFEQIPLGLARHLMLHLADETEVPIELPSAPQPRNVPVNVPVAMQNSLTELANDLEWLEQFEPPTKKMHVAELSEV